MCLGISLLYPVLHSFIGRAYWDTHFNSMYWDGILYYDCLQANQSSKWCSEHFLNFKALRRATEIHQQLTSFAARYSVAIKSCRGIVILRLKWTSLERGYAVHIVYRFPRLAYSSVFVWYCECQFKATAIHRIPSFCSPKNYLQNYKISYVFIFIDYLLIVDNVSQSHNTFGLPEFFLCYIVYYWHIKIA